MKYEPYSIDDLEAIAEKILNHNFRVALFHGDLGVGKTTLIKVICKYLGVEDDVSSPTFSIVNQYLSKTNGPIYHFDLYRIESENELMDIGYEEYFYGGDYCFVEWPERATNILPENALNIFIREGGDNNRLISIAP